MQESSSFPERLPNGRWNCSIPNWEEYREHFSCNLATECVAEEDEVDCPYSGCGVGNISVPGSCFMILERLEESYSWEGQSRWCQKHGGHLATLGTPLEWNTVTEALRNRKEAFSVLVGLTTTSVTLPSM